jgi:hypothetical protein
MSAKINVKSSSAKKPAPKPGKDVIYIDVDDEITAIIDKVDTAKQKIVALVLPKRAATLQSIVNMRLLKRSAAAAGKSVVLITSENALIPLAGAAGLHVAKNLQSKPEIPEAPIAIAAAQNNPESEDEEISEEELDGQPQKLDYEKPIGELASAHEEPEEIALDNEDHSAVPAAAAAAAAHKKSHKSGKGLKVPDFDKFRLLLFGGIGALVLLIVFLIFATKVLPKAKVTVTTTSTPVSLDTSLTASGDAKALDESKKIIPSVLKTSDQSINQQVKATGQKNLGEKATGSATLKNCGDNAVTLPAGTGFSANGANFITQKSITLNSGNFTPPPTSACKGSGDHVGTVSVAAQSSGTKYNVNDVSVTVVGSVTGTVSASGGTDNNVTILTQQDVDAAKAKITSGDSDKFSKDFQKQLEDQGLYIFASTLKIADPAVTSTPAVGEQTDNASVHVKITYSVLAVQKTNLETLVKSALEKQIDKKKEKLSDDNVLDGLTVTVQNQNQANATLAISKDSTAIPILNLQAIKEQSKGKKTSQIKSFINAYPGVKNVDVKYSPFWVSSAPKNTAKITVTQNQLKGK